ncbi:radical SAM superfamily-domain-containing protein [Microdochium trichocladiopsis]|uniref:S-adenosyl-L-methionine-dependent tRNA 4-demethylwyosine synthase n=1 Tax=Microdochium trichocladiopsis TaxID=1682393 RepID=A0A9P9BQI3_9PEZI|nr:radical SAM superfamily-domain-containing protein [Microdochium trichocladiopsis]KAH7030903.1 radical SAM superfamily-domain-containing protein [Microdochium trichocladiopsis]
MAGSTGSGASGLIDVWHQHRAYGLVLATGLACVVWLLVASKPEHNRAKTDAPSIAPAVAKSEARTQEKTTSQTNDHSITPPKVKEAQKEPRRIKGEVRRNNASQKVSTQAGTSQPTKVLVFYSSLTAGTEKRAGTLMQILEPLLAAIQTESQSTFLKPELLNLAEIDYDEYFISPPKSTSDGADDQTPANHFYLFLLPSYNIDTINDTFIEHLKETHNDFRIDTAPLSGLIGYSVFGTGDREGWPTEDEGFCFQAKEVDKWMAKLTGRKRAYPVGMADAKQDFQERLEEWTDGIKGVLNLVARTGSLGEGVPGSGDAMESDDEDEVDEDDGEVVFEDGSVPLRTAKRKDGSNLEDVEDLGRIMKSSRNVANGNDRAPLAVDFTTYKSATGKTPSAVKEMVSKDSPTYKSLTKQGYSIVGSHSGVKICRWTKSALRGRGSCYKYSFYGINSHQCMETTPSLSCSNKCVFCWRHGTNPVGTTWRWKVDPPELIFDGVKAGHYQKIKMMRGVPGVRAERFAEAMRIRHCALSLVGEPIFYPYINEFLSMLHAERISSFLVCNAQHPDQLAALKAVTQLYVSIDASNKESLRKIDRPLHRDFWERFQRCLDILREKRFKQRTVFRLTLVKGFNIDDEVEGYADLVERGLPCFVEIKGVTYCGTSTSAGAGLSMANVPFYEEVTEFVEALTAKLQERGLGYGIAAEHAHSCCVLIASDRFNVDGKWHTRIDYQRFFELLEERGADGDWTPEDYMGEATPEWATWGNGGFDPRDERVDRKGRKIAA